MSFLRAYEIMGPRKTESVVADDSLIGIEESIRQSITFIGQWQNLISTTNWEKGEIIVRWRRELASQDLPPSNYTDETWSRIVDGVSPQHVGRLRRTFERFGGEYSKYPSIYWSHFYAALDWHDAEMWLEGAVQSNWSVSQMRMQRWEATGRDPLAKPRADDIVTSEIEEELSSLSISENPAASRKKKDYVEEYIPGPRDEDPDFGNETSTDGKAGHDRTQATASSNSVARLFGAFENLPEDVSAAAEDFKLCIIRHKSAGWADISREQISNLLDALKQLAHQD